MKNINFENIENQYNLNIFQYPRCKFYKLTYALNVFCIVVLY